MWPWIVLSAFAAGLFWWLVGDKFAHQPPIVVGILHSLTGPSAAIERTMVDAETLAIEEIDRSGGLLGRRVRWVVADGGSDPASFAKRAERLIREDKVSVIIGCASPAGRRAVVPVVEAAEHLLVFPSRHEGFEESPAVVSLGPLPNQSVGPAVAWCREALSAKRFFVVGADDTWGRSAAACARDQLEATGAAIVAEEWLPTGATDVSAAVRAIVATRPDVVCCLLSGDATAALMRRLREAGVRSADIPVLVLGIDEDDLRTLPRDDFVGTYVAAGYFQSFDRTPPRGSVSGEGGDRVGTERMTTAQDAVRLWADAVRAAGTADPAAVRAAIRRRSIATPEGVIAVDPTTQHAWRNLTIGRIRPDGMIETVWASDRPTRPVPFPVTRSRTEWIRFLAAVERARADRRDVTTAPGGDAGGTAGERGTPP